jgi:hypothetical protein
VRKNGRYNKTLRTSDIVHHTQLIRNASFFHVHYTSINLYIYTSIHLYIYTSANPYIYTIYTYLIHIGIPENIIYRVSVHHNIRIFVSRTLYTIHLYIYTIYTYIRIPENRPMYRVSVHHTILSSNESFFFSRTLYIYTIYTVHGPLYNLHNLHIHWNS